MAKKESVKKGDKKPKKQTVQLDINDELTDKTPTEVVEREEIKIETVEPAVKEEDNENEETENTVVSETIVENRSIESIEVPVILTPDGVVSDEDSEIKVKENVSKKQITTSEMFGYNWMGQIYDY